MRFLTVALLFWASTSYAQPHDPSHQGHWYDFECCGLQDCFPMSSDEFVIDDGNVVILETGEAFPMNELRPSQDGEWHRCIYLDNGITRTPPGGICIYMPGAF